LRPEAGLKGETMHRRISVNGVCFPKFSLQEDVAAWNAVGAHTVGEHVRKLNDAGWTEGLAVLRGSGKKIESLVHPSEFRLDDGRDWEKMRADFCKTIDAAKSLGAASVYTTSGHRGELTWEAAAEGFSKAMRPVLDYAKSSGIHLLVEPTVALHADKSIVHTLRDTVTLAEMSGLGICIDIFHCWTEAGLKKTIAAAGAHTHLVQVGDYAFGDRAVPCRAVIGDGDIPLQRIIGWILEAGYTGFFDLELNGPRIEREGNVKAVQRGIVELEKILANLGAT
jgi:sugar phosphate isomerase/epimerase